MLTVDQALPLCDNEMQLFQSGLITVREFCASITRINTDLGPVFVGELDPATGLRVV